MHLAKQKPQETPKSKTLPAPSQGLFNRGVMCYRNSILQTLLHVPSFIEWLEQHQPHERQNYHCTICALRQLAAVFWSQAHSTKDVTQNVNSLETVLRNGTIFSKWRWGRQQDANEFYLHLVSAMLEGDSR